MQLSGGYLSFKKINEFRRGQALIINKLKFCFCLLHQALKKLLFPQLVMDGGLLLRLVSDTRFYASVLHSWALTTTWTAVNNSLTCILFWKERSERLPESEFCTSHRSSATKSPFSCFLTFSWTLSSVTQVKMCLGWLTACCDPLTEVRGHRRLEKHSEQEKLAALTSLPVRGSEPDSGFDGVDPLDFCCWALI